MIEFIGKLHPLLVHLPIGFLVVFGAFELLTLRSRKQHLIDSSRVVLALTFPITVASIVCGWLLADGGEYTGPNLFWHRWLGTGLGLTTFLLLALHWGGLFRLYRWGLAGTLGLLIAASHFGGSLTHGNDYFKWPGTKPTLPVGELITQPAHAAVIQPIFNKYCVSCHGPDKAKGGLRLDTIAHLVKGGDSGSAIESTSGKESLLGKRLALPLDDDDHMPPDGKPQLSADQLASLNWWLHAGAPTDKTIQELKPTPEILQAMGLTVGAPVSDPTQNE